MKKQLIYLLASAAVVLTGCSEKQAGEPAAGYGRVQIACMADADITTRTATVPSGADFALTLTGNNYEGRWATVAQFADTDTTFVMGTYSASITYGDPAIEGFDKPYYTGSESFDILPRRTNTVEITAKLANSQVLIRATDQFLAYFHDAQFTVTTDSKNEFVFKPGSAEYTGESAYVKAATSLKVTGTAKRQSQNGTSEGLSVTFSEQTLANTKARTRHIFEFDAADAGSATLNIYIGTDENGEDLYIETHVIEVELNDDAIAE